MSSSVKFIADANVMRLGKWLRILGCDAYSCPADAADEELILVARAENRTILTKDTALSDQNYVQTFLLTEPRDVFKQLKEVIDAFHIEIREDRLFSRCLNCNVVIEPVEKEQVENLVPPYVYKTQSNFWRCPSCKKIYWKGTHLTNTMKILRRLGLPVPD